MKTRSLLWLVLSHLAGAGFAGCMVLSAVNTASRPVNWTLILGAIAGGTAMGSGFASIATSDRRTAPTGPNVLSAIAPTLSQFQPQAAIQPQAIGFAMQPPMQQSPVQQPSPLFGDDYID